ncbi:MAG: hypothetical protein ABEJ43_04020 [Haloferacaceae archaeon]
MNDRLPLALVAAVALIAATGVAAAQSGGGGGLIELIDGIIDFLRSVLDLLSMGGGRS